jgi:hypothetical protein
MRKGFLICLLLMLLPTMAMAQNTNIRGIRGTDGRTRPVFFNAVTGALEVTMAAPPTGGATEAKQDDMITHLLSILAKILTAPATEAKQDDGIVQLAAILAKIIAAPATEATSAMINADTASILADTTSIDGKTPALGQATKANSVPVTIASDQAGTAIISSDGGQDASWLEPSDTTGADANQGTILVAEFAGAPTVVKVYTVPTDKEFHDISLTGIVLDGNAYQFTYQVFGMDVLPTVWTIQEYMSIGYLLVPAFTVARLSTTPTVPHSLVRSRSKYFVVVISSITVAPAQNKLVRVKSYNPGDELP